MLVITIFFAFHARFSILSHMITVILITFVLIANALKLDTYEIKLTLYQMTKFYAS